MSDLAKKELPAFNSEAEEAQWWFDNREAISDEFVQAVRDGRATYGAMARRGIVRTPSIAVDPEDFSQAILIAKKKGIHYESYLRLLIHDGVARDAALE